MSGTQQKQPNQMKTIQKNFPKLFNQKLYQDPINYVVINFQFMSDLIHSLFEQLNDDGINIFLPMKNKGNSDLQYLKKNIDAVIIQNLISGNDKISNFNNINVYSDNTGHDDLNLTCKISM